jgi:hypothetical protein
MEYCHCHIVFTFQNQEFKSFPVEQTIGRAKKPSYGNNISIFIPVYWYQKLIQILNIPSRIISQVPDTA